MRTPAGKECRYYFQDFHRGKNVQECRLEQENPVSARWKPSDCARCPVPDILRANASANLQLTLTIVPKWFGLIRTLNVTASCLKHRTKIADPFVGCEACNNERPGLDVFLKALNDADRPQA